MIAAFAQIIQFLMLVKPVFKNYTNNCTRQNINDVYTILAGLLRKMRVNLVTSKIARGRVQVLNILSL